MKEIVGLLLLNKSILSSSRQGNFEYMLTDPS